MKQYLTRPDGTIPENVNLAALEAEGIKIVRPTETPRQPGMVAVEVEAEFRDGIWWQAWRLEPAPAPAPPPVPAEIALWRFRAVLRKRGMFDAVNAYLEARRHTPQGIVAWEAWEYGNVVERDSPLLKSLSGGFGVTEADLDGVFHEAAALSA